MLVLAEEPYRSHASMWRALARPLTAKPEVIMALVDKFVGDLTLQHLPFEAVR